MNDDLTLNNDTLIPENEIQEDQVVIREKPNLLFAKLAGYAIPLVAVAIALFWVIPLCYVSCCSLTVAYLTLFFTSFCRKMFQMAMVSIQIRLRNPCTKLIYHSREPPLEWVAFGVVTHSLEHRKAF